MLPGWVGQYVEELARATQTPADLPAMVVLSALATSLAKKVEVSVRPGYSEPVNIYTVTAMEPGNRKSAVFADATSPIEEHEAAEAAMIGPEITAAQTRYEIVKQRLQKAQSAAATAQAEDRRALEEDARQLSLELGA